MFRLGMVETARMIDQGGGKSCSSLSNPLAVAVQGLALTDLELRSRVRNQTDLAAAFLRVAGKGGGAAPQLADTVQRHATVVLSALGAHVDDTALPRYQAPDLTNGSGLLSWGWASS